MLFQYFDEPICLSFSNVFPLHNTANFHDNLKTNMVGIVNKLNAFCNLSSITAVFFNFNRTSVITLAEKIVGIVIEI